MMQWFKWWHGSITDAKWRTISRRSQQPITSVLSVWAAILENASSNAMKRGVTHEWNDEVVGDALGIESTAVESILKAMDGLVLDDDTVINWSKYQSKRDDDSRERVREHRKRKVTQGNAPVTHCNGGNALDKTRQEEIKREKLKASLSSVVSGSAVDKSPPRKHGQADAGTEKTL